MSTTDETPEQKAATPEEIDTCFANLEPGSGPLDGRTFEGTASEEGKTEPEPLHLIFRQGALLAVECMPYAFGAGPYSATTGEDGSIAFTSEIRSLKDKTENHLWKGRVTDGRLTGTMVWTDPEGKTTELSFEARQAGA